MKALLGKYRNLPVEVKASGWYMVCNIVQNGLGFITLPIFSRILTTEEYGLFSVYLTWMNLLIIFTNLNLQFGVFNTAMIKFEKERDCLLADKKIFWGKRVFRGKNFFIIDQYGINVREKAEDFLFGDQRIFDWEEGR